MSHLIEGNLKMKHLEETSAGASKDFSNFFK